MPAGQEKKKRIDNTVAHIENKDGKYCFNDMGWRGVSNSDWVYGLQ
jgi:hypothetical protein